MMLTACFGITALALLCNAVLYVAFLRRRHDRSNSHIFWVFGIYFLFAGSQWALLTLQSLWFSPDVWGTCVYFVMVSAVSSNVVLLRRIRSVMEIPNITELFKRSEVRERDYAELRQMAHDLKNALQVVQTEREMRHGESIREPDAPTGEADPREPGS